MLPRRDHIEADQTGGNGQAMDQKISLLGTVPLFAGLDRKDLEEIGRLCDEVDLPAERVIARQGSSADAFYIILDGTVAIERDGALLRDMGPGEFFGELAMVAKVPRTATATSKTPTRLLVLGHAQFNGLMAEFPAIRICVLQALADRISTLQPNASTH